MRAVRALYTQYRQVARGEQATKVKGFLLGGKGALDKRKSGMKGLFKK